MQFVVSTYLVDVALDPRNELISGIAWTNCEMKDDNVEEKTYTCTVA